MQSVLDSFYSMRDLTVHKFDGIAIEKKFYTRKVERRKNEMEKRLKIWGED